jgi:nicotinamidase-related amidase
MAAMAAMEHAGVPVDVPALTRLRDGWGAIKEELVRRVDAAYGVFDGVIFKLDRFSGCRRKTSTKPSNHRNTLHLSV